MTDFFQLNKMISEVEDVRQYAGFEMQVTPEVVVRAPKKYIIKSKYDLEANNPEKDFPELYKVNMEDRAKSSANA